MKTIIHYFTGTGNSLEIARTLAQSIPGAQLRSLAASYREGALDIEADCVGFVFPVHFFGIPPVLRHLLESASWGSVKHTFAIANSGGMPGAALYQAAQLIRQGGGKLDAGYLVLMPDNYLPMFQAPTAVFQQKCFDAWERRLPEIAAEIRQRKAVGIEKSKMRVDRFIAPFTYPTVYKFKEMDREFWLTEACNGCSVCAKSCSYGNIEMSGGKPEWQHRCEMCLRCIHICPQKAIQYKKSTLKKGRYIHPNVKISDLE